MKRIRVFTKFAIAMLSLSIIQGLSAISFEDLLSETMTEEERKLLRDSSYVYRYDENHEGIKMLPRTALASQIRKKTESTKPDIIIEVLTRMPIKGERSRQEYLAFAYNYFVSISSISGIHYTSSKGVNKKLFSEVYRVKNVGDRVPLPDPGFRVLPQRWSMKAHMKEVNFGRGYYKFDYYYDNSNIAFSLNNLSKFYKILLLLKPGGLNLNFLFIPFDNEVLIYMNSAVKIENKKFVLSIIGPYGYFHNRINLLYSWIYRGLVGSNAIPPIPVKS